MQPQTIQVPLAAVFILKVLRSAGHEAYIVGGAVRDTLLRTRSIVDYDFTTSAKPEEIQALFPEHFYENTFGTVGVAHGHLMTQMGRDSTGEAQEIDQEKSDSLQKNTLVTSESVQKIHDSLKQSVGEKSQSEIEDEAIYEITTFRSDGAYSNFRKPESVEWGSSLTEDLQRRDFTINALALAVHDTFLNTIDALTQADVLEVPAAECSIYDPYAGYNDLVAGRIVTVGEPDKRFTEDALRMLRAIRFSTQLGMHIEPETYTSITKNAQLLVHISKERIRDEFLKMITSPEPRRAIEMLDETGLLEHIIPELLEGKGVQQAGHHTTDVWTHNLDALHSCPSKDPIVRLATLIHDIAKPHTRKMVNGLPTFYNHEIIGARIAKQIAQRLRLSKKDVERMFLLVRYHMFHYQPENTDASIRRFMRKIGIENINDILDLREADRLGSGARETSWRLEEMKQRMLEQLNQPFAITDLAINGHDLMTQLELSPGPQLGKILNTLFEEVLDSPELNTKEILLEKAKMLIKEH